MKIPLSHCKLCRQLFEKRRYYPIFSRKDLNMKITKKVSDLLNEQFYNELYAAHIYFAMSASLRHSPYQGMSKWMRLQAKEEMEHAMKIYEYLIERGAEFKSDSIKKPECDSYGSPLEIFKAAYAHEQKVTAQIEKICDAADEDKDRATSDYLAWFVKEQVEEESNTLKFVRGLEYAGDDKNLLIGVDKWAGSRAE